MDIDRSKENIQPLRGGRNPVQLGVALNANSDAEAANQLALQQREHESLIDGYDGPDPLEPWFNYIQWVEQCFPKHGHEGHIDKLIKDCLAKFENDERYTQDRRFLRLWIKYIDYSNNPLEFYQMLYNRGLGTGCSELYRAWACYCEEATDYAKADHVYKLGMQYNAEPREELDQAYKEFQTSCSQRWIHNDSPTKRKAASALAETRLALTTLRTVKRRNTAVVPSQRTGDNVYSVGPGTLRQNSDGSNQTRSNVVVSVYVDRPGPSSVPDSLPASESAAAPVQSLLQSCSAVENQKEVGLWTNSSTKTEKINSKVLNVNPTTFTLFEDDRLMLPPNHVSYCREDLTDFCVRICVPDPDDSTKIPMYNKKEVYKDEGSTLEYSPEEIRARKYLKTKPSTQSIESPSDPKIIPNLYANCQFGEASIMKNDFKFENVIAQSNSILNADDPQNGDLDQPEEYVKSDKLLFDTSKNEKSDHYNCLTNDVYGNDGTKGKIVADFNKSLLANLHGNDSMTFHTKEAHRELNLFPDNDSGVKISQFDDLKFEIREDHSMTMASAQAKVNSNSKMKARDDIDGERLSKNFAYEIENKQFKSEDPVFFPQEDMPQINNRQNMADIDDSTQMFTFNVMSSSTPCNNQFKKPHFIDAAKRNNVRSFDLGECGSTQEKAILNNYGLKGGYSKAGDAAIPDTHQGGNDGLYTLMETTQEYRSGSSSSGSNQTTGNTIFGYTARESTTQPLSVINEKMHENLNQDSAYHQSYPDLNAYTKRQNGIHLKGTTSNNVTHKNNFVANNENRVHLASQSSQNNVNSPSQFHNVDHQYHKSNNATYSRFNAQRNVPQAYQGATQHPSVPNNNGYQNHIAYQHSSNTNHNYQMLQQSPQLAYHPHGGYQNAQHNMHSPNAVVGFQSPPQVPPAFQSPQHAFQNSQQIAHGFQSPQHGFQSPQHGFQSPQRGFTSPQQGFTSPQQGFTSPQQGFTSPQQGFTSPQHGFASPQHVYANSQPGFTNQGYTNSQQHVYQKQTHQVYTGAHVQPSEFHTAPQTYANSHQAIQNPSHNYMNASNSALQQTNQHFQQNSYAYPNNSLHSSYQNQESSYSNVNHSHYPNPNQYTPLNQNHMKPQVNSYNNYQNQQTYTMYKNPQNVNTSQIQYHESPQPSQEYPHEHIQNHHSVQNQHNIHQGISQSLPNTNTQSQFNNHTHKQQQLQSPQYTPHMSEIQKHLYQSPTSKLRSVRHEVPHMGAKPNAALKNPNFSNQQHLHFITSRNEPKDNANTPKFSNSPTISQKMHKNLYVSSPEQAQVPPNTEISSADISKESALQTSLPSQNRSIQNIKDKYKEQSKRQLDFENRIEVQSEDSRDSAGKECRVLSVHSRQSNHSMHTDSENSMDCQTISFNSNCSNSMIATRDIPMPAKIDLPKVIDPFNIELCNMLLEYVKFPNKNHYKGYYELKSIPKFQNGTMLSVDIYRYTVEKQLGKGTFGSVFRGSDNITNESVALKHQKPGHPWEYYICQEIKARITDPFMLPGYMDIRAAFFGDNASVFVSELSVYGSLLDVANKIRAGTTKCIAEFIVMLMASEMLSIIHHLHKAKIIHGDIKPDNFLVMKTPQTESRAPSLQLIDFGCAIDMSLFPEGTTFKKVISTDGFTCTEMRDDRPWTFQTDLYCLAGTVYVILMGNYMQTAKRGGQWTVEKKWPRYMKSEIWDKIFTPLLNVKDCSSIPDLLSLKDILDEFIRSVETNLATQLRTFDHILKQK